MGLKLKGIVTKTTATLDFQCLTTTITAITTKATTITNTSPPTTALALQLL